MLSCLEFSASSLPVNLMLSFALSWSLLLRGSFFSLYLHVPFLGQRASTKQWLMPWRDLLQFMREEEGHRPLVFLSTWPWWAWKIGAASHFSWGTYWLLTSGEQHSKQASSLPHNLQLEMCCAEDGSQRWWWFLSTWGVDSCPPRPQAW